MRLLAYREKNSSCESRSAPGRCGRIRRRLLDGVNHRLGPEARWVQRHVANCPRCQKRLAALTKVNLALSAIKSQPHQLDLLMKANTAAVKMLSHALRREAQDRRLEEAKPEPCVMEKFLGRRYAIVNVAACVAILFLTKAGIFSSLDKARAQGREVMKHYYTAQVGEDLASEVFES
jgi:anti-sigma factor RsiW